MSRATVREAPCLATDGHRGVVRVSTGPPWLAQAARKEFVIRAGLETVSQYEAEHGLFTPEEIAEADEWAARVTQPAATQRSA